MITLSASMTGEFPVGHEEDAALFLAWRSRGDQQALNLLLQRLTPSLWSLARRITGLDADAEDALQHVLLQMVQQAHAFSGGSLSLPGSWRWSPTPRATSDDPPIAAAWPNSGPRGNNRTVTTRLPRAWSLALAGAARGAFRT